MEVVPYILATRRQQVVQDRQRLEYVPPIFPLVIQSLIQDFHHLDKVGRVVAQLRELIQLGSTRAPGIVGRGLTDLDLRICISLDIIFADPHSRLRYILQRHPVPGIDTLPRRVWSLGAPPGDAAPGLCQPHRHVPITTDGAEMLGRVVYARSRRHSIYRYPCRRFGESRRERGVSHDTLLSDALPVIHRLHAAGSSARLQVRDASLQRHDGRGRLVHVLRRKESMFE